MRVVAEMLVVVVAVLAMVGGGSAASLMMNSFTWSDCGNSNSIFRVTKLNVTSPMTIPGQLTIRELEATLSPTSPTIPSSPASPTSPTSPASPTSLTSPTSTTSPTSPTSPTNATSPTSPTSPTSATSPNSPTSPTSATSPTSPTSATSPNSPTSPTSATSPTSPTSLTLPDDALITFHVETSSSFGANYKRTVPCFPQQGGSCGYKLCDMLTLSDTSSRVTQQAVKALTSAGLNTSCPLSGPVTVTLRDVTIDVPSMLHTDMDLFLNTNNYFVTTKLVSADLQTEFGCVEVNMPVKKLCQGRWLCMKSIDFIDSFMNPSP